MPSARSLGGGGGTVLPKTVTPLLQKKKLYHAHKLYHAQNMSHLDYFYRLFPGCITAGSVTPINKSVGLFFFYENSI